MEANRVLLIFLDGVGIGPDDPERNPFLNARLPTVERLLGPNLPTLDHLEIHGPEARAFPLDATLGIEGLPQSGTGQIALLTGVNAPRLFGRHFGPWPPVRLRDLLAEQNILSRARQAGHGIAFANAYPRGYPAGRRSRRVAAPPLAAAAAGVLERHAEHLARGEAVASEIVNTGWRVHLGHAEVPEVTPEEAGANLARIAGAHDLTLYAHYATDHVGHRGGMEGAVEALERVDAFLSGVLGSAEERSPDGSRPEDSTRASPAARGGGGFTTLIVSDHGNLEDVTAQHTRNPTLGLVHGPGSESSADVPETIAEVASWILSRLDGPAEGRG